MIDWTNVEKLCHEYYNQKLTGYADDDLKQFIFEAAMEAVHGEAGLQRLREKLIDMEREMLRGRLRELEK